MTAKKQSSKKTTAPRKRQTMQPRTRREDRLVDYVLEHAEEIRAARRQMVSRVILISPHYTPEQKAEARRRLVAERGAR
jgi:hypothetical protein